MAFICSEGIDMEFFGMVLVISFFFQNGPYSVHGQGLVPYTGIVSMTLIIAIVPIVGWWVLLSFVARFYCNFIWANSLDLPSEALGADFGAPLQPASYQTFYWSALISSSNQLVMINVKPSILLKIGYLLLFGEKQVENVLKL